MLGSFKLAGRGLLALGFALTTIRGDAAAAPPTSGPDPAALLVTLAELPGWELLSSSHHEFLPERTHPSVATAEAVFRGPIDGAQPRPEVQVDASFVATPAQAQHDLAVSGAAPHLLPPIALPPDLGDAAVAWHYASSATATGFQMWILQGNALLFLDSAGDPQGGPSDALISSLASAQARQLRTADRSATPFDWSATLPSLPRPWDVLLNASDVGDEWSADQEYHSETEPPHPGLLAFVNLARPQRLDGAFVRSWVEAYESVDAAVHRLDSTLSTPAFPLAPMGDESEGVTSVDGEPGRAMQHWTISVRRGAVVTVVTLTVPADEVGSEQVVVGLAQVALARLDARLPPAAPPAVSSPAPVWREHGFQIPSPPELAPALELIHQQGFDSVLATLSQTPTSVEFDPALGSTAGYDSPHGIRLGPAAAASSSEGQAALIVHEATHVRDELAGHRIDSAQSCYAIELRAVANQVAFWRSLWGPAGKPEPADSVEEFHNTLLAAYADISTGEALVHTIWAGTCGPG
jgi:hypothetical protein